VIELVVEVGKFLLKHYEKDAEAQNLVLSIQKFIKVGAPEEARKCCYELIRLRHKHPDVYFLLANALYELKEYDNCLKAIQEAIEIQSSPSYWELKGDALKALDRHQEAIDVYNQAIKLNPSSQSAKQKRDACHYCELEQLLKELERLLKAKEWYEADQLTDTLMLKVSGREREKWIDWDSINELPCKDLQAIDKLWVRYSSGLYGFSVQKQIYVECGSLSSSYTDNWNRFCDRTAWKKEGKWVIYPKLFFEERFIGVKGHLPRLKRLRGAEANEMGSFDVHYFFSRIETCGL
jgi:tetratricopeptide (TPR) repeat protein